MVPVAFVDVRRVLRSLDATSGVRVPFDFRRRSASPIWVSPFISLRGGQRRSPPLRSEINTHQNMNATKYLFEAIQEQDIDAVREALANDKVDLLEVQQDDEEYAIVHHVRSASLLGRHSAFTSFSTLPPCFRRYFLTSFIAHIFCLLSGIAVSNVASLARPFRRWPWQC